MLCAAAVMPIKGVITHGPSCLIATGSTASLSTSRRTWALVRMAKLHRLSRDCFDAH